MQSLFQSNSTRSCPSGDSRIAPAPASLSRANGDFNWAATLAIAASLAMLSVAPPVLALSRSLPAQNAAPGQYTPGLISQALLQLEAAGEAVTQLQTQLTNLGYYDGPISGVFGELTQSAVINFQQRNGLSPDGIVGAETLAAIDRAAAAATSTTTGDRSAASPPRVPVAAGGVVLLGDTGADVTTVQQRLAALGYYQGAVDGQFGPQTEAALIAFQQAQGLKPDGIVGTATFSALNAPTTPGAIATSPTAPVVTAPALPATLPPSEPATAFPTPPGLGGGQPTVQAPAPVTPVRPVPDVGVLELQRQLARQGFYSGPLDGVLGPETQRAIAEAQRSHGINPGDINGQF